MGGDGFENSNPRVLPPLLVNFCQPMVWKPSDSETNEILETFKGGEVFLDVTSEACVLV